MGKFAKSQRSSPRFSLANAATACQVAVAATPRRSPRSDPSVSVIATQAAPAVAAVSEQAAAITKVAAPDHEAVVTATATTAVRAQRPTRSSRRSAPATFSGPEWTTDIRRQGKPSKGPRVTPVVSAGAAPAAAGAASMSAVTTSAVTMGLVTSAADPNTTAVSSGSVFAASEPAGSMAMDTEATQGATGATPDPAGVVLTETGSTGTTGSVEPTGTPAAGAAAPVSSDEGKGKRGPYHPSRTDNHVVSAIAFAQETIGTARDQPASRPLITPSSLDQIAVLLPDADTVALGNLPEDFMGCGGAIEQILSVGKPGRAKSIQLRFAEFVERERAVFANQRSEKMKLGTSSYFRLADDAAVTFFTEQGVVHGSRTHNHQCGHAGCTEQKCCPLEYNFSTVESYADRLAADTLFEEHAHVFSNKIFKKHVREGVKRQQTDGRHPLPAPPVLLPHAECIAHEGYSAVKQSWDSFYGPDVSLKEQGQYAWQACRDAQHLAVMATDLGTGKRTADVTSALTKDFYRTGSKPGRKFTVCHRTSKITLPVHPWCVREMPDSVLCPVAAIEHYLATCREFGVHIGPASSGQNGKTPCSPFLFPFITKDPETGFPVVTDSRVMRNGAQGSRWEKVSTSQCNAWLKHMLERLDGTVITDYTIHGCRVVAALVFLGYSHFYLIKMDS